jgi:hypothetical protein
VSATAGGSAVPHGVADKLGIAQGAVVQELGWDDDCDDELRQLIASCAGSELVDEDYEDVVDVVVLWWREGDGDLVDALVDARRQLSDDGVLWLLTPKAGRDGHVEPSDVLEAVPTAGLVQTSTTSVASEWTGIRLAGRRGQAKTR